MNSISIRCKGPRKRGRFRDRLLPAQTSLTNRAPHNGWAPGAAAKRSNPASWTACCRRPLCLFLLPPPSPELVIVGLDVSLQRERMTLTYKQLNLQTTKQKVIHQRQRPGGRAPWRAWSRRTAAPAAHVPPACPPLQACAAPCTPQAPPCAADRWSSSQQQRQQPTEIANGSQQQQPTPAANSDRQQQQPTPANRSGQAIVSQQCVGHRRQAAHEEEKRKKKKTRSCPPWACPFSRAAHNSSCARACRCAPPPPQQCCKAAKQAHGQAGGAALGTLHARHRQRLCKRMGKLAAQAAAVCCLPCNCAPTERSHQA